MFCLRSWIPLLFIPTNAPPIFIFTFFLLNFLISRPCMYCSLLLLVTCFTSCYWADHCFFDFGVNWFVPRPVVGPGSCLYGCPESEAAKAGLMGEEWTGLGLGWMREILGRREWTIEFLDVTVRL